jgi:hypothetical protein
VRYVKVKLRQALQLEGAARKKDRKELENFYYYVICQVLKDPLPKEKKAITWRSLKAKIIRLHSLQKRGVLLDTDDKDRLLGEDVTIHHYVKSRKRKMARRVTHLIDETGALQTDQREIMRIFTERMVRR